MTDAEHARGVFEGSVTARLDALEAANRRLQSRLWWALAGAASLAARPYVDALLSMVEVAV